MMKALPRSFGASLLGGSLLISCDSDRADAVPSDARPAINLDAMGDRAIDTLAGAEAEALCEEDARRSDPCLELALASTQTPEACERLVEECRAKGRVDAGASCAGINLGPPGTCSIRVDEYFRCLDAFAGALRCSEAGNALELDACKAVATNCERLAPRFTRNGRQAPCDSDSGAGQPPDTDNDIFGVDRCRPTPARLVILGDSIANCYFLNSASCSPYLIADRLRATVSPGLAFETVAVNGARLGDVPAQARQIAPGPGHVFVWLFAIGNDLLAGDPLAENADLSPYHASLDEISDYFSDATRFPDGASFLLNGQYGIYDDCDPPGPATGALPGVSDRMQAVNKALFLDRAVARADTVAVDHYPDWLGHGRFANVRGCPHCGTDNTGWLLDPVHPNAFGHGHIAEKWRMAFDQMFAPGCMPESAAR
jgi:hypothetical protein